jgi:hypothetical protein
MLRQLLTFRYVSYLLAALLAVTAALKLHLLLTDPFADIKTAFSESRLRLAAAIQLTAVSVAPAATPQAWQRSRFLINCSNPGTRREETEICGGSAPLNKCLCNH